MKLKEIYGKIDAAYPKSMSDGYVAAYGGHDNSGILIDEGREISGALFSLDFSQGAIGAAEKAGANLIVTHHPAIFFPVANLLADDPLGARLLRAVGAGIGVISMHLNIDCAPGGTDESLARALSAKGVLPPVDKIDGGGYGRVFDIAPQFFSAFAAGLMRELDTQRAFIYGEERTISRVASFCGAGLDGAALSAAKRGGAQAVVSADIKHNIICDALESGLNVVQLTHYASENYGFKKIYQSLKDKLGVPCFWHEDAGML